MTPTTKALLALATNRQVPDANVTNATVGEIREALREARAEGAAAAVERIRAAVLHNEHEYLWPTEISDPDTWDEEAMGAAASVIAGVLNILDESTDRGEA